MDIRRGGAHYTAQIVQDDKAGNIGLEIHRRNNVTDIVDRIATVIYWDASGETFVQTFDTDVPFSILKNAEAEVMRLASGP